MRCIFVVFIAIGLLHPSYSNKDAWWNQLMAKASARHTNHWTTTSGSHISDPRSATESTAQSTIKPVRRSGQIISDNEANSVPARQRGKSWDKSSSRTTRHSYKKTWGDNQPVRERFIETEWDDEVPVRHIFKDTLSSGDKEKPAMQYDKEQYERPSSQSRQSFADQWDDNEEVVRPEKQTFSTTRNSNNNNANNNKPTPRKATTMSWNVRNINEQPKAERLTAKPERVTAKSERVTAKSERVTAKAERVTPKSERVTPKFERVTPKSERVTAKNNNKNTNNKRIINDQGFDKRMQSWDKLARDTFKDVNNDDGDFEDTEMPNLTDSWDDDVTTSAKPELLSAKVKEDRKQEVTKKPSRQSVSSTFGWRSSINHGTSSSPSSPSSPSTSGRQKSTTSTTSRSFETSTTIRPKEPTTSVLSVERAKLQKPSVTIHNSINDENKKKQHRIGNWVNSDQITSVRENENGEWTNTFKSQSLREEEFDDERIEQLPERVEVPPPQSARQRSRDESQDYDDPKNWRLEDSIPGSPVNDYPTYASIPKTSFDCSSHEWPGYYADVEAQCQVFHICQAGGRKNSFLCPNGTMFNQKLFVCDWWHNVQCTESTDSFGLNANIYDYSFESKKLSNQQSGRGIRRTGTDEEISGDKSGSSSTTQKPTSDTDTETEDNDDDDADEDSEASSTYRDASEFDRVYFDDDQPNDNRFSSSIVRYKTSRYNPPMEKRVKRFGDRL